MRTRLKKANWFDDIKNFFTGNKMEQYIESVSPDTLEVISEQELGGESNQSYTLSNLVRNLKEHITNNENLKLNLDEINKILRNIYPEQEDRVKHKRDFLKKVKNKIIKVVKDNKKMLENFYKAPEEIEEAEEVIEDAIEDSLIPEVAEANNEKIQDVTYNEVEKEIERQEPPKNIEKKPFNQFLHRITNRLKGLFNGERYSTPNEILTNVIKELDGSFHDNDKNVIHDSIKANGRLDAILADTILEGKDKQDLENSINVLKEIIKFKLSLLDAIEECNEQYKNALNENNRKEIAKELVENFKKLSEEKISSLNVDGLPNNVDNLINNLNNQASNFTNSLQRMSEWIDFIDGVNNGEITNKSDIPGTVLNLSSDVDETVSKTLKQEFKKATEKLENEEPQNSSNENNKEKYTQEDIKNFVNEEVEMYNNQTRSREDFIANLNECLEYLNTNEYPEDFKYQWNGIINNIFDQISYDGEEEELNEGDITKEEVVNIISEEVEKYNSREKNREDLISTLKECREIINNNSYPERFKNRWLGEINNLFEQLHYEEETEVDNEETNPSEENEEEITQEEIENFITSEIDLYNNNQKDKNLFISNLNDCREHLMTHSYPEDFKNKWITTIDETLTKVEEEATDANEEEISQEDIENFITSEIDLYNNNQKDKNLFISNLNDCREHLNTHSYPEDFKNKWITTIDETLTKVEQESNEENNTENIQTKMEALVDSTIRLYEEQTNTLEETLTKLKEYIKWVQNTSGISKENKQTIINYINNSIDGLTSSNANKQEETSNNTELEEDIRDKLAEYLDLFEEGNFKNTEKLQKYLDKISQKIQNSNKLSEEAKASLLEDVEAVKAHIADDVKTDNADIRSIITEEYAKVCEAIFNNQEDNWQNVEQCKVYSDIEKFEEECNVAIDASNIKDNIKKKFKQVIEEQTESLINMLNKDCALNNVKNHKVDNIDFLKEFDDNIQPWNKAQKNQLEKKWDKILSEIEK